MQHLTKAAAAGSLAGKTALVTGASGGIGRAISEELARRGAQLIATGRSKSQLSALYNQLSEIHPDVEHKTLVCDLQEKQSLQDMCKQAMKSNIDILVNNAGISQDSLLLRQKSENVIHMIQVNLLGCMEISKEIAGGMVRRRSGCIINISSVIGLHGNVGQSAYATTKAGIIGFTKSLAKELGPRGIRANAIAPGFIDTKLTRKILDQPVTKSLISDIPLQRVGTVEDVAHGAAFLAENTYITGQVLVIDGGLFI
ncbi:hypothetical protein LPJ64_002639 [Coemansia asiatica]|uniref:3-oxoacyl-[acyl-carrier-protein] reductase n=1 Tax=Coemansia asiatica TaxID=1052880 RepID=A0A9W8CJH2_9FUNG|nr:hypothetical protein LPJ64_002639 [Coemansia asiatica]